MVLAPLGITGIDLVLRSSANMYPGGDHWALWVASPFSGVNLSDKFLNIATNTTFLPNRVLSCHQSSLAILFARLTESRQPIYDQARKSG
jgi:hypothetical protein